MGTLIPWPLTQSAYTPQGLTCPPAFDEEAPEPLEYRPGTTLPIKLDLTHDAVTTTEGESLSRFSPPRRALPPTASADTTPLQIWEGTVVEVDNHARVMRVSLDAKLVPIPRHMGEIDLEWVAEQDQDLVRPGAVFYLTLFKRTKRGSVENAQELRFRRRPAWSSGQLKQIEQDAAMLLAKMKPLPTWE
jgi:hypothetical protein